MKSLVALLPVVLLAGCAIHSRPCPVPVPLTPQPEVTQPTPAPTPTPAPAPVVETPTPMPTPVVSAPKPVVAPVVVELPDIYFDFDKSNIRADQQPVLQSNIAFLRDHPTVTFRIIGSADVRGATAYNAKLSQRRVNTVHAALAAAGVDGARMLAADTIGKTSTYCSQPVQNVHGKSDRNLTDLCYQLNRRVHFVIVVGK